MITRSWRTVEGIAEVRTITISLIKFADIYSAVKHVYVTFATMHRRYPLLIAASAYALAQQLLFVLLRPLWGTMSMIII
jgi:hypothetical protein